MLVFPCSFPPSVLWSALFGRVMSPDAPVFASVAVPALPAFPSSGQGFTRVSVALGAALEAGSGSEVRTLVALPVGLWPARLHPSPPTPGSGGSEVSSLALLGVT